MSCEINKAKDKEHENITVLERSENINKKKLDSSVINSTVDHHEKLA